LIEITPDQLERKIKLLTLSSLAFKYIGQNLPYSEIAEALKIDTFEVEKWVIDGKLYYLSTPLYSGTIYIHGF
jgi:PCI domain